MNQCRFSNGKARIIRIEKIKASESLCWVWREGILQRSPELVFTAAAVDGNRHAGTHGRVGDVAYAVPEKPELGFRVNVLIIIQIIATQQPTPEITTQPAPERSALPSPACPADSRTYAVCASQSHAVARARSRVQSSRS